MTEVVQEADGNTLNGDDDAVVVPSQNQMEVFLNTDNDVVLREYGEYGEQTLILVPRLFIPRLIKRLQILLAQSKENG